MFLQQFSFDIKYRKGAQKVADVLSRLPQPTENQESTITVVNLTCAWYERKFKEVAAAPQAWPSYNINSERLYRRIDALNGAEETAWKLCVPRHERSRVLHENHDSPEAGHGGIAKTSHRVAVRYYWPGMFRDVAKYVKSCQRCQQYKVSQLKPAGQMKPPRIYEPWDTVTADIMGPLPTSKKGNSYLLVLQDRMTKWVECRALRRATATNIIKAIQELIIFRFGCPRTLLTDNTARTTTKPGMNTFRNSPWP